MAIQLSPSVLVQETDLTNVVPAVSASTGATVIDATWGPVSTITSVDSENVLAATFGKPTSLNAQDWFAAANFLSYTDSLLVVRTDTAGQKNAVATLSGTVSLIPITSGGTGYTAADCVITVSAPQTSEAAGGIQATAEPVITGGVITSIRITNPGAGYTSATAAASGTGSGAIMGTLTITQAGVKINNEDHYNTSFASKSASIIGAFAAKYPGTIGNGLTVSMVDAGSWANWNYKTYFQGAPGTTVSAAGAGSTGDEMHIVVVDTNGKWTGMAGTVLETFGYVSKASDAKREDGTSAYYKNVINSQSKYVWSMGHQAGSNWGSAVTSALTFTAITGASPYSTTLAGGADDMSGADFSRQNAFTLFDNDEQYDLSLVIGGKSSVVTARHIIQNVAEKRKDCMAFISPVDYTTNEPVIGNTSATAAKLIAFKNDATYGVNVSSSYAVFDSGYKYQYDRYNDIYRWVPLCGDVAGLCARTDATNDPWWSPAGFNRGQIKNVVKLAYNPRKTDRDTMYVAGVNPVVSFPGQGVVLYGDKTALAKPSAFDRINVRRLFITLEKAISTAAKYQLFQFNDAFTRAQFKNMVEPYLRDVQGRRGLIDFKVVCDETNNTGEVIDGNRFIADIYLKPARSINYITLNFVATRTSASFSEIAGV